MPVSKINRNDTVFANNVQLPSGLYKVCITKSELGVSEKGNDKITLTCEIVEPEAIEVEGQEVRISGQTFPMWLTLNPSIVGSQRESNMAGVWKFCDKLGVTDEMELNENGAPDFNPNLHEEYFKGMTFDIPLISEKRIKRMKQTPEQKKARVQGTPILDGEGREIDDGWEIRGKHEDVPPNCNPARRDSVASAGF